MMCSKVQSNLLGNLFLVMLLFKVVTVTYYGVGSKESIYQDVLSLFNWLSKDITKFLNRDNADIVHIDNREVV
jgi:hypothetical protein